MTIYNELKKLAIKMDVDVSNTHNIMDIVRKMSARFGGDSNGPAIADAVRHYAATVEVQNTLRGLTLDADISEETDLLGKTVDELQTGARVDGDLIVATSLYAEDYTGFSGDPEQQKGNYIVVHAKVPDVENVTIKVTTKTEDSVKTVTLDEDGILVFLIRNPKHKNKVSLTFTASAEGYADYSRTYLLNAVTCLKQGEEPPEETVEDTTEEETSETTGD